MKRPIKGLLLLILLSAAISGCSSFEANRRAANSSVARIAGMEMANGGGLAPSFAIVGENDIVLPTDQLYLMSLKPYLPQFLGYGSGSYRFAAKSQMVATQPQGTSLQIKPLGFAKAGQLQMFFLVSADPKDVGKHVDAKISTDLVQSVDDGKPLGTTKEDMLSFNIADPSSAEGIIDDWQQEVRTLAKAPQGAVDLGSVEVKPGKIIWSDYFESYSKLKKRAANKGANVITDLELISKENQNAIMSTSFGFRAHAWKVN